MSALTFKDRVETKLPQDTSSQVLYTNTKLHDKLEKVEGFFNELDEIYEEREKYSLHWAFDNASNKLSDQLNSIDAKQMDSHNSLLSKNTVHNIKSQISTASNRYDLLSKTTLLLDIVISVILILGITLLAQRIEESLESFLIVTSFIGLIALCKVGLDRFYIIPHIDNWGWNRYHQLTHRIGDRIIEMILDEYLIITDVNPTYTPSQEMSVISI